MLSRLCNLPKNKSFFLFGARQTGKTTLINNFLGSRSDIWAINLLDSQIAFRYLTDPALFYREATTKIKDSGVRLIFIDEVQKVPALLDSVQQLIHEQDIQFILTGSSARKLKRGGANLLGGRAIEKQIYPLTAQELGTTFKLEDTLRYGSIPGIILEQSLDERLDLLSSYVSTYLREEIQQEAIVRNVSGFASFLEVAAQNSGAILNYANVGRDASLHGRTVQTYYEILEETLIGMRLPAYKKSIRKRLRHGSKFYLFDIGVLNALERQLRSDPDATRFGRLFEHFIVLETHRLSRYLSIDAQLFYWQTKDNLEVDLLIENKGSLVAAIEIKSSMKITSTYLSGLKSFQRDYPNVPLYVVARVDEPYELDGIRILPWQEYTKMLPQLFE